MVFTVARQGGTKDVEFEEYGRLLRQRGIDLANAPRAPEPVEGRRWLPVWQREDDARAFADELKRRMKDDAWGVVPVNGPPSEGPLGPIEITIGRQSDGWWFTLHPLSRLMVRSVFPDTCRTASVFIRTDRRQDFQTTREEVAKLADQVVVILTGLPLEQIKHTFGGYRVYDLAARKEMLPSDPVQSPGALVGSLASCE